MQTIKEIIEKHLGDWNINTPLNKILEECVIEKICREMCEMQKKECANNATSGWDYENMVRSACHTSYEGVWSYVEEESILNCPNVCDYESN